MRDDTPTLREFRSISAKPPRLPSTPESLGCRTGHRGPVIDESPPTPSYEAEIRDDGSTTECPRGRVLVIAADPERTGAVQELLDETHDVAVSHDPREALLGIARGEEYDIVLCDLELPFVPADAFRDQVAAMNLALGERIVFFPFDEEGPKHDGTPLSAQLDASQLKARVAELVSLRTMPPRGRYRASR